MKLGYRFFRGMASRRPVRMLLISLCALFSFCALLGLKWADATIFSARERFETDCGTGDIVVYTEQAAPGALEEVLRQIPGVALVDEGVISQGVRCVCPDGTVRSVRFVSLRSHEVVTPLMEGEGDFALSYGYAADFPAGKVSQLTLPNGERLRLSAVAYMPLFTGVYAGPFLVSTDGDVVDVYTSFAQVERITGESYVNYAVLTVTEASDVDAVVDAIMENGEIFVSYAAPAAQEAGYHASLSLEEQIHRICNYFPWLMLAVGLMFAWFFLAGVADRSSGSIFVLLAEGAPMGSVFWGLFLFGLTALLAGFLGAVPLSALLAEYVTRISLENMGLPGMAVVHDPILFVVGFLFCFLLALVAAGAGALTVSGRYVIRLRHRVRRPGFRALSHVLVTGVSIAASVFMVVSSLMFLDSLHAVRQEQFSDRYGCDAQILYEDFVPVSRMEELVDTGLIERCEPMLYGAVRLEAEGKSAEVTCVGLSREPLITVRDRNGAPMITPENGIILSESTARKLDVKENELVELHIRYGGAKITALCQVAGISRQSSDYLEVVSLTTVEEYLDSSGVMNGAGVQVKAGHLEEFCAIARTMPEVAAVQTGQGARQRFDSRYAGTKGLVSLIIVVGVLLGLSVCLLMCYSQWKQEIRKNTILTLLGENSLRLAWRGGRLRLLGMVPGLIVGMSCAVAGAPRMLAALSVEGISYPTVNSLRTMLLGLCLCLGCEACCQAAYILANRHSIRHFSGRI